MSATLPSGEQFELAFGAQRAVFVEVGGGLRAYSVDGIDVVDGYAAEEMSSSGRGQLLIPWPNRIAGGVYEFEGETHRLALTEPEHGNAIHGLVRWVSWSAREREAHRVVLSHLLHPQPGYPFTLALEVEYSLSDSGLAVRTTATNVGSSPCPFGSGQHPYLRVGAGTIDRLTLQLPARTVLLADEGGVSVEGTAFDFRRPRPIGTTRLDTAFTALERGDDGRAQVELRDPAGSGPTLWVDEAYRYLMVYSGDDRPDVARRSVAVEPMTCPPNAFRTGVDLITLQPGATATAAWGIRVTDR